MLMILHYYLFYAIGCRDLSNVCDHYGLKWDISYNPIKSHLITFGGTTPDACEIYIGLNGKSIPWVNGWLAAWRSG